MSEGNTLPKTERLYHKKLIDSLFGGGKSRSMTAFPLRLVYMPLETTDKKGPETADDKGLVTADNRGSVSQMLISVPNVTSTRPTSATASRDWYGRLTASTRRSLPDSLMPWHLSGWIPNCGRQPMWSNAS